LNLQMIGFQNNLLLARYSIEFAVRLDFVAVRAAPPFDHDASRTRQARMRANAPLKSKPSLSCVDFQ
jgi:hypothetical protein